MIQFSDQKSASREAGRALEIVELGLVAGLEPRMSLEWLSKTENIPLLQDFISLCRKESYESALQIFSNRSTHASWRIFFELLKLISFGVPRPSDLVSQSRELLLTLEKLEGELRSSLFLPRFQMTVAVLVCLLFAFGIPAMSGGLVPSFITQDRWDLFASAMAVMGLGVFAMHRISLRPRKAVQEIQPLIYFFRYLSVFLQAGQDLGTSWRKSYDLVSFPVSLALAFKRDAKSAEPLSRFLERLQESSALSDQTRETLVSVLWATKSGLQMSQFFSQLARRESDRLQQIWQLESRKMSSLALIPMTVFVMPASLFLLLGPQLLELSL